MNWFYNKLFHSSISTFQRISEKPRNSSWEKINFKIKFSSFHKIVEMIGKLGYKKANVNADEERKLIFYSQSRRLQIFCINIFFLLFIYYYYIIVKVKYFEEENAMLGTFKCLFDDAFVVEILKGEYFCDALNEQHLNSTCRRNASAWWCFKIY